MHWNKTTVLELIENKKFNELHEYLESINSADFPNLFDEIDEEKVIVLYRLLLR